MAQPAKKSPSKKPAKKSVEPVKRQPAEDNEPLRICYVDDDVELTRMVSQALADEGWEILTANDGESGLELILSEQPDLILLDVMMPGLTGWEICKYIRTKPDWANTPILMLTGIGERMNAMTAPLYGADAHLDKPFDIDELIETVRQLGAQALAAE
ncbi:MAG TPA: response regulator [Myxococcota bacterium]|nr:response regulator [Myxococcota bacterium]